MILGAGRGEWGGGGRGGGGQVRGGRVVGVCIAETESQARSPVEEHNGEFEAKRTRQQNTLSRGAQTVTA